MARPEQAFYYNRTDEQRLCYVQGVRSQGLLFMSGVASLDTDGRVLHPQDMEAQMRCIYSLIREMLESQSIQFQDIVKEVIYTTDMDAWRATLPVRQEVFAGMVPPAGSVVEVARLFQPGLLLEIEVVAQVERNP
jgi:enamine deaminase RidA (YjgF/YER057c/UK114 family)